MKWKIWLLIFFLCCDGAKEDNSKKLSKELSKQYVLEYYDHVESILNEPSAPISVEPYSIPMPTTNDTNHESNAESSLSLRVVHDFTKEWTEFSITVLDDQEKKILEFFFTEKVFGDYNICPFNIFAGTIQHFLKINKYMVGDMLDKLDQLNNLAERIWNNTVPKKGSMSVKQSKIAAASDTIFELRKLEKEIENYKQQLPIYAFMIDPQFEFRQKLLQKLTTQLNRLELKIINEYVIFGWKVKKRNDDFLVSFPKIKKLSDKKQQLIDITQKIKKSSDEIEKKEKENKYYSSLSNFIEDKNDKNDKKNKKNLKFDQTELEKVLQGIVKLSKNEIVIEYPKSEGGSHQGNFQLVSKNNKNQRAVVAVIFDHGESHSDPNNMKRTTISDLKKAIKVFDVENMYAEEEKKYKELCAAQMELEQKKIDLRLQLDQETTEQVDTQETYKRAEQLVEYYRQKEFLKAYIKSIEEAYNAAYNEEEALDLLEQQKTYYDEKLKDIQQRIKQLDDYIDEQNN